LPLPILLLRKGKLRHSLGRPSRSDFVQLDVIYSYVTSIKEEVAKLFEIANSYSKSFDI